MAQPTDLQTQLSTVQWTNGQRQITGAYVLGLFTLLLSILSGMGTWTNGVYSPSVNLTTLAYNSYISVLAKLSQTTDIDDYGAVGDGKTDDVPALARAAATFAGGTGGKVLLSCSKNYAFLSPINLAQNYPGVVVQGCLSPPDDSSISAGGTPHPEFNQNGRIIFGSGFQATIGASTGFEDVMMTAQGCSFPTATTFCYAGTPLALPKGGAGSSAGNYAILHRVMVIGAALCFDGTGGGGRLDIRDFRCDGNSGEIIGPSLDTSIVEDVHNYPYGTAAASGGATTRAGNGIVFTAQGFAGNSIGNCDDTRLDGYLDFGNTNGALIQCNGNIWLGGTMWLDDNGGVGLEVDNSTNVQGPSTLHIAGCGICLKLTQQSSVQMGTAVIYVASSDCINVDGFLTASSISLLQCSGNGVTLSQRSWFNAAYLRTTEIGPTYPAGAPNAVPICAAANMASNQIWIGQSVNDTPFGTAFIGCNNITLPGLTSAATLNLPAAGTAGPLAVYVAPGAVSNITALAGSWGGREIVLDLAPGVTISASSTIKLKNGATSIVGPATYAFRLDQASVTWQQEW